VRAEPLLLLSHLGVDFWFHNTQDQERRTMSDDNTHMATAKLAAANTWLQEEIKRLRLTDAEREAVEWAEELAGNCEEFDRVDTLRNLLERTK
jgi:hypothetical protein